MSKIHGGLSDDALLAQTRKLAHLEQQLQVTVIDHLREIHTRRLYLSRGFSSLFDYAVRELSYTDSAASRRINAMHLCAEFEEVREGLQDGSFTLSTAAQLQSAFDRQKRNRQRKGRGPVTGSGSAVPRQESLLAPSAGTAQPPEPAPLLDVSARQALVKQAVGKSTRQVQELLAGVDPELTVPADKMRPVGNGCYEMKVVIDAECHRGLERLRGLLSWTRRRWGSSSGGWRARGSIATTRAGPRAVRARAAGPRAVTGLRRRRGKRPLAMRLTRLRRRRRSRQRRAPFQPDRRRARTRASLRRRSGVHRTAAPSR